MSDDLINEMMRSILGEAAPKSINFAEVNREIIPPEGQRQDRIFTSSKEYDLSGIEVTDEYLAVEKVLTSGVQAALFVTGEAGTGKSTLIHYLISKMAGVALVAPTAIAATNIGGATLHSFFGLFPSHNEPNDEIVIPSAKRLVLEKMTCLIIDEISMVPPNLIDVIDKVLRQARDNPLPFGGVSVMFVGDLFQLPPVVSSQEESIFFSHRYRTRFFFSAVVFERINIISVRLRQVRRQKDILMTSALADIRIGQNLDESLGLFNRECYLKHSGKPEQDNVHLVPTNSQANEINNHMLATLPGETFIYYAKTEGVNDISKWRLNIPARLELKIGAKVVFLKNNAPDWINGDTAVVIELTQDSILVKLDRTDNFLLVQKSCWYQYRYSYNYQTREIEKQVMSSFEQYPLAAGWALTIHKSQGMTLSDYTIDFSTTPFDSGQVYVALSRAKSLDSVRLTWPVRKSFVKVDSAIFQFYQKLGLL